MRFIGSTTRRQFQALGCAFASALCWAPVVAADAPFVQDGRAGFVVSGIRYALSEDDKAACPDGLSLSVEEIYAGTPAGKRRAGESDAQYGARLQTGAMEASTLPDGRNICVNPEAAPPDPFHRAMTAPDVPAYGIDLDGQNSRAAAGGSCAHDDLPGMNGESGIDNQFYRVVGCSRSFHSTGQSNAFDTEMFAGSWGILITLDGLDDLHNDESIEVGVYANADPIRLSPTRKPLEYATYAMQQDPRFRAQTRGRLVDGVLTTEPFDFRAHSVVNSIRLERELWDARLQLTLSPDGHLEGHLAGYSPVEALYDTQFGYRNGKNGAGEPAAAELRLRSANGAARVLGYSCPGMYRALHQYADGHPDASGRCTSISTQYRIKAIPAFVVDVATQSSNETLNRRMNPGE